MNKSDGFIIAGVIALVVAVLFFKKNSVFSLFMSALSFILVFAGAMLEKTGETRL
ncbi:MAG: hypothetical protein ACP5LX_07155 [Nitrososphaeria archaeon]